MSVALETRSRPQPLGEPTVEAARPITGLVVAIMNLGVLIELFCLNVAPEIAAFFLVFTFVGLSVPVTLRYVRSGRLVATPALVLYGLMLLYSAPVILSDMLFDFPAFRPLARSALILAVALNALAIVLLAWDDPRASPETARLIERHQWSLCLTAYAFLGAGVFWLLVVFQDLGALYEYLFETNYYGKHIYFEGKAYQGLFVLCFELAGAMAGLALAVPRSVRTCPLALSGAAMALVIIATVNQGYRTTIVLMVCQYVVARALWSGAGVRILTLAALAGALAPAFLMWAFIRHHLSSGDIRDLRSIAELASEANWANIHDSEIGVTLNNGGHLLRLLDTGEWRHRWGETLVLDPLIAIVPRVVWADRPDSLQIAFTRVVDPTYAEGGTISFSFSLEGYLNFGILGAAAWSGALAGFLIFLRKRVERMAALDWWTPSIAAIVLYSLVWFYIRDDFGDLVRRALIAISILAAVCWAVRTAVGLLWPAHSHRHGDGHAHAHGRAEPDHHTRNGEPSPAAI